MITSKTTVSNNQGWVSVSLPEPCPTGTHEWKLMPLITRWGWSWVKCEKCGIHPDTEADRKMAWEISESG